MGSITNKLNKVSIILLLITMTKNSVHKTNMLNLRILNDKRIIKTNNIRIYSTARTIFLKSKETIDTKMLSTHDKRRTLHSRLSTASGQDRETPLKLQGKNSS